MERIVIFSSLVVFLATSVYAGRSVSSSPDENKLATTSEAALDNIMADLIAAYQQRLLARRDTTNKPVPHGNYPEIRKRIATAASHHHQHSSNSPISTNSKIKAQRNYPSNNSRNKRQQGYGPAHPPSSGQTGLAAAGPVYTFMRTDLAGNYKWGVRHSIR
ncbi:unnamed protein product [Notodromas monacha]|uniref:Uncharacterized protein n=1 Tax=Notodromas monacha TaxID=399045 RepID=A0A7R9GDS3_9CRUS|nr:unnamed protein product [Notodromas monacha]CAG0917252.1 unnamed protein product [Notodromas monacha]